MTTFLCRDALLNQGHHRVSRYCLDEDGKGVTKRYSLWFKKDKKDALIQGLIDKFTVNRGENGGLHTVTQREFSPSVLMSKKETTTLI